MGRRDKCICSSKGEKTKYEEDTFCDIPAGRGDEFCSDQQLHKQWIADRQH
jgi:hypothetical protein